MTNKRALMSMVDPTGSGISLLDVSGMSEEDAERFVNSIPNDFQGYADHIGNYAVRRIHNQDFLKYVLGNKSDIFLRIAAVSGLEDHKLLKQYAETPDEECNQQRYIGNERAMNNAFHKSTLRHEAIKRLKELGN